MNTTSRHLIFRGCLLLAGAASAAAWASGAAAVGGVPHPSKATAVLSPPPSQKAAPAPPAKLIDINSASRAELTALPGIGDTEAERIIANRPYLSKAELVTKKVILTGPYLSLKDRVMVLPKFPPPSRP